jgi:bifunctional ADP-heptose synthase (sugar kinase/adenylyltransferase)
MIDLSKIKTAEQKAAEAAQAAKQERIAELKQLLRDTDYVVLSDYDKDKPDVLLQRQAWRDEIRELEA